MSKPTSVPIHPEDQKILEITRELCRELRIFKINPKVVSWVERYGLRKVPHDYALFLGDQLRLSKSLMGKLQPEEWKPFLATNLIYQTRIGRKMVSGFLVRMLPAVALIMGGIVGLDRLLENQFELSRWVVLLLYLPLSIGLLVVAYISLFRYMKRLWFDADSESAQVVGKENLVATLRKLESVQSAEGARASRLAAKPSLAARLSKLQQV